MEAGAVSPPTRTQSEMCSDEKRAEEDGKAALRFIIKVVKAQDLHRERPGNMVYEYVSGERPLLRKTSKSADRSLNPSVIRIRDTRGKKLSNQRSRSCSGP